VAAVAAVAAILMVHTRRQQPIRAIRCSSKRKSTLRSSWRLEELLVLVHFE